MNETHQNLIRIGTDILSASRNELYLSMRFLDLALSGLRYEMNLSSLYVGTDGEKILFNPRYLVQRYLISFRLSETTSRTAFTDSAVCEGGAARCLR